MCPMVVQRNSRHHDGLACQSGPKVPDCKHAVPSLLLASWFTKLTRTLVTWWHKAGENNNMA